MKISNAKSFEERKPLYRDLIKITDKTIKHIGYGALVLLPFRSGEAVRPLMIRRKGALSAWAATGTVAAERIVDGVVLSLILLAGLRLAPPQTPLPDHIGALAVPSAVVPRVAYAALAVFGVALAAMTIFYFARDFARRLTERIVGVVSARAAAWLADAVSRTADGLGFLPRARYSLPFILATFGYFLANVLGVALLVWGSGLGAFDLARACVIVGVLHIGVLLPNAPGYFGAFQLSVYAALALYYPPGNVANRGSAIVFVLYVTQIGLALAAAAVALMVEHLSLRDVLEDAETQVAPAGPRR